MEKDRVRRPDPKGHLQRYGRGRPAALPAQAASHVHQRPHLFVTRPGEPHYGCRSPNAAVHLGDRNGSPRLSLDLVQQPVWNARGEGEHDARVAGQALRNRYGFAPKQ